MINVRGRLQDLVIWRNISGPVLVVKLLLQLLKKRLYWCVAPKFNLQKTRKSL